MSLETWEVPYGNDNDCRRETTCADIHARPRYGAGSGEPRRRCCGLRATREAIRCQVAQDRPECDSQFGRCRRGRAGSLFQGLSKIVAIQGASEIFKLADSNRPERIIYEAAKATWDSGAINRQQCSFRQRQHETPV